MTSSGSLCSGVGGRHLRACDWDVRTADRGVLVALVEQFHYSRSAANTAVYRHGLFLVDDGILGHPYGAALWMPPTKAAAVATAGEAGWLGVLSLSRLVVHPDVPTNGASFLLGRSMQLIDRDRWPVLVTYADAGRGHTGAIYRATNWTYAGEVPAGDTWIGPNGEQRGRKRGPRNLTAAEMEAEGFVRAPNLPKHKFVHDVRPAAFGTEVSR